MWQTRGGELTGGRLAAMMLKLNSCLVAVWLALACGARAQSPERVMTDTADYCAQLQLEVDDAFAHAASQPPADVRELSDDGHVLCRRGEIRGGIMRLRRALMALRQLAPR